MLASTSLRDPNHVRLEQIDLKQQQQREQQQQQQHAHERPKTTAKHGLSTSHISRVVIDEPEQLPAELHEPLAVADPSFDDPAAREDRPMRHLRAQNARRAALLPRLLLHQVHGGPQQAQPRRRATLV